MRKRKIRRKRRARVNILPLILVRQELTQE